jgi:hypothetical protein
MNAAAMQASTASALGQDPGPRLGGELMPSGDRPLTAEA